MSINAKKILIEWANEEKNWIRNIVREVIETHENLPQSSLDNIYQIFLADSELSDTPIIEAPKLILGTTDVNNIDQLVVNKIENTENVNKLMPDQAIVFNKSLTVLFGENAAGKSGYVRVFKRLAAVRSQEEILPNIHTTDGHTEPKSTIHYSLGETNETQDWNGEAGVSPFTRISVFDTKAFSFHVDDDLTYYYIPKDIALYKFTHEAIQSIKQTLESNIDDEKSNGNPFLSRFRKESSIYTKLETLGPSTDLKDLETLANIQDQEESNLESLREQVESLNPQIINSRLELSKANKDLFERVNSFTSVLNSIDWNTYNESIDNLHSLKDKHKYVTENLFKDESIDGILGESWRSFIEAGEIYIKEIKHGEYPSSQDKCIYCNQDLNEAAINLVKKYREFCNNSLNNEIAALTSNINNLLEPIVTFNSDTLKERLEQKDTSSTNEVENKLIAQTLLLLREFSEVLEKVNKREKAGVEKCITLSSAIKTESRDLVLKFEELIKTLDKQGEERDQAFKIKRKQLNDLEDRIILNEYLPQIKSFVNSAKWVSKATIINSSFTSILRSLTIQTKLASEDLLNKDFEKYFEEECKQLRAPAVKLEFPGRQGQAARRKSLHHSYRLSDILSEGEQKVIALADFLAESSIKLGSSPIVFDDPVTSLDYKRLEYIVGRILDLSKENQVIVFTHNIWFATSLLAKFSEDKAIKDRCSYYEVSSNGELVGKITAGTHPRWDTQKLLRGKVNQLIQDAESHEGETQQALIERTYDLIRAWCEVVMEQEILQHVVQRYSPHVAMTMIQYINFGKLETTAKSIFDLYEKSCRLLEAHSQPLETLHIRPKIDELKEDWKNALEVIEKYKQ